MSYSAKEIWRTHGAESVRSAVGRIGGKRYDHDVLIRLDGKVKKRAKKLRKKREDVLKRWDGGYFW